MRPGLTLRRVADLARFEGIIDALAWRVLYRSVSPLATVGVSRFYTGLLTSPLPDPSSVPYLTVGPLGESDVEPLAKVVARRYAGGREPRAAELFQATELLARRLQHGQRCFVPRRAGEIVHYGWVTFGWIEWPGERWVERPSDPGRLVVLAEDEAFHSDAYTVEAWRGRRLYGAVLTRTLQDLRQRRYRRVYTEVNWDNSASWKTHERLGWHVLDSVLYAKPRWRARAWRWPVGGEDLFVDRPAGHLAFRRR